MKRVDKLRMKELLKIREIVMNESNGKQSE
jgi:hypothetical protein